jgi:putative nucleotidyltransferase with HDIG domain
MGDERMIINPQVPLNRLILSLSQALDYVHPSVMDHQQRVAYIAIRLAQLLGLDKEHTLDLLLAAALHDIGLVGVENRIRGLHTYNWEEIPGHAEAGYVLLTQNPLLARCADIVRYHHTPWENGRGAENNGCVIPYASHILVFADSLERMIDRNSNVLDQTESITAQLVSMEGKKFHPDCVNAFREIADVEAFWLDCVSVRIYSILLEQFEWPTLTIDGDSLEPIARMFGAVVDATSQWTATHSAGVAAVAVALAERYKFSPRELSLVRAAGYLHDLGKLTVPTEILDKSEGLTPVERNVLKGHTYHTFRILNTIGGMPQISEWAAFHHERLDGSGYPFHHAARDLTLGSRIMAVADVFGAITEDRPYHKAMERDKVMSILNKLAGSNGLDGDIVHTLEKDYNTIYQICMDERLKYSQSQKRFLEKLQNFPALI